MKYTTEVVIDLPRNQVIELFDDPDNLPKWQKGLQLVESLEGFPGMPGARTRLVYDQEGRKVDMTETVIARNLPDELSVLYETRGVKNWAVNRFYEVERGATRWVMTNEFKFSGLMAIAALVMRNAFPRQTLKDMKRFKVFAEHAH